MTCNAGSPAGELLVHVCDKNTHHPWLPLQYMCDGGIWVLTQIMSGARDMFRVQGTVLLC